ncbi:DUF1254 domain-containing protein [Conexibacter woesei]|uniref:DUF1254 domain-containing protein n=1 Tax=Conexibacter woesei (strain DSM 14684 / CCUG 47730 / CIP 108061 / JCM 11494 / NBRC 100937 / ID131577) TaxID=469383 RepID=D3EZ43_CONWI|nr:DUF1254 domain-containing protein [Conexibacter woesei]ADB51808.1 protein of unknown function DUF1254 [Conexibacter woesei DSM 14684]
MADEDLSALAAAAYVYGFPLVFDLEQVQRFSERGLGQLRAAPFNTFAHAAKLATPQDTFVSVNNDTLYSIAQLDLSAGAQLLHVPDSDGRYYVLQFVDAWTNNFAYVGRRGTGTGEGTFLLTPPGWSGTVPAGARRIAVPTGVATIVGRWACEGTADVPAVRALQQQLTLTDANGDADAGSGGGVPTAGEGLPEAVAFFERLRVWMAAFPPSAPEQALQRRFAPLGLLDEHASFGHASASLTDVLAAGYAAGQKRLEEASHGGLSEPVNGWSTLLHMFDYNADWFELGTLDTPEWKIADRERAHVLRAVAARVGLWGNHAYEAFYAQVFDDADGERLDGGRRYEIRFETLPPVDAFWSLTMYDTPDYYLVANPLERYSIGDRTRGLVRAADGSLTLVLQHEQPDEPERRANWLPTPAGGFRPLMRLYQPRPEVLEGRYELPPVVRVG